MATGKAGQAGGGGCVPGWYVGACAGCSAVGMLAGACWQRLVCAEWWGRVGLWVGVKKGWWLWLPALPRGPPTHPPTRLRFVSVAPHPERRRRIAPPPHVMYLLTFCFVCSAR